MAKKKKTKKLEEVAPDESGDIETSTISVASLSSAEEFTEESAPSEPASVDAAEDEAIELIESETVSTDVGEPSEEVAAVEASETPTSEPIGDEITDEAEPRSMTMRELTAPIDSNLITDVGEIESVLEAIVFSAPKAIGLLKIKNLLRSFSYDVSMVVEILDQMIEKSERRGFQLVKVAGGYQFRSHPMHAEVLQKLLEDRPAKLSPSALEVLSIVAYKQPITRTEIDSVRGVDSGHLMKGLLEKNLIRTQGHAESAGRPMLYGTAPYFLEVFGLNSLDDLPALDQMNRELVNDPSGGSADGETLVLAGESGSLTDSSSLAANPDRGDFDAPTEEVFDNPDFGEAERALEN